MKVNFGMSNMLWVELEARWRCLFWALLLAEVSLTLLSGLVASLEETHACMAPFFGVDHNWTKQEESNAVSISEVQSSTASGLDPLLQITPNTLSSSLCCKGLPTATLLFLYQS